MQGKKPGGSAGGGGELQGDEAQGNKKRKKKVSCFSNIKIFLVSECALMLAQGTVGAYLVSVCRPRARGMSGDSRIRSPRPRARGSQQVLQRGWRAPAIGEGAGRHWRPRLQRGKGRELTLGLGFRSSGSLMRYRLPSAGAGRCALAPAGVTRLR